uniref:Protein kinase domain-containing protein n=1 Tax=Palpitomonas bilix TaxID=652834 RepID=A0A7S3D492_9EUKA|mmetsp:Transcript_21118/g.54890  ORF Transcript_21118/g.54890 Transcript_21118/m.54890 type:complete len:426 (+) Transcript_21118:113-1390(+)
MAESADRAPEDPMEIEPKRGESPRSSSATQDAKEFKQRPFETAPIHKLTVQLLKTYKHINEVYYSKKRGAVDQNPHDDANGDFIVKPGIVFQGRYKIEKLLGKGSFGQVVRAFDSKENVAVAMKIVKNRIEFHHQAKTEIEILNQLKAAKYFELSNICELKDHFIEFSHQCLVFELYAFNLYELLKTSRFRGVSLHLTKKFTRQILRTLYFLSMDHTGIIHCDLKPENIMLKHARKSALKVIDFGSACKKDDRAFTYIQSRFYRSPEILLGLDYSPAIDIWSLACIIVELHTGEPLFGGRDEIDQMFRICEVLGTPPKSMLERSKKVKRFFVEEADGTYTPRCSQKHHRVFRQRSLEDILGAKTHGPNGRRKGEEGHNEEDYMALIDLLKKMLTFEPAERINPEQALLHPSLVTDAQPQQAQNSS